MLKNKTSLNGFTLVEILVVVALVALLMAVAVPNLGLALKANLNNSSRELATVIRLAHDEAVLKGDTYRIAFDLDKQNYWVEAGPRGFVMLSEKQAEDEASLAKHRSSRDEEKKVDPFSLAKGVTKKKLTLSKGVKIYEVENSRSAEPIKSGLAHGHFFPHGLGEKLIVHLKDDFDRESTVWVDAVTGKSRVFPYYFKEAAP